MRKRAAVSANRRTFVKLALTAVLMFGFGFALVPLYNVFCELTGLNGKTGQVDAATVSGAIDASRTIRVEFTGNTAAGLPWEFRPITKPLNVHPGEIAEATYYVRNSAREAIVGRAIPSVAPSRAAAHFNKIECFCFSEQRLAAGETKEMKVRFVVSPELLNDVGTITLSYAFFNADKQSANKYGGKDMPADAHGHDDHAHADGHRS